MTARTSRATAAAALVCLACTAAPTPARAEVAAHERATDLNAQLLTRVRPYRRCAYSFSIATSDRSCPNSTPGADPRRPLNRRRVRGHGAVSNAQRSRADRPRGRPSSVYEPARERRTPRARTRRRRAGRGLRNFAFDTGVTINSGVTVNSAPARLNARPHIVRART